jgi:hypothetical protein
MSCGNNAQLALGAGIRNGISGCAAQSGFITGRRGDSINGQLRFGSSSSAGELPLGGGLRTQLVPSRLRLAIDQPDGAFIGVVVKNGRVVLSWDGMDTGLALAPGLKASKTLNGGDVFEEDTGQWWLVHVPSGRMIAPHGYSSIQDAHQLAGVLATKMDWTRDEFEISMSDLKQARATMEMFDQTLGNTN